VRGLTIIGTAVGRQFTSDAVSVIFLTLAAGSILYVIIQLLGVAFKGARARTSFTSESSWASSLASSRTWS
jgi:hypothetical protein